MGAHCMTSILYHISNPLFLQHRFQLRSNKTQMHEPERCTMFVSGGYARFIASLPPHSRPTGGSFKLVGCDILARGLLSACASDRGVPQTEYHVPCPVLRRDPTPGGMSVSETTINSR